MEKTEKITQEETNLILSNDPNYLNEIKPLELYEILAERINTINDFICLKDNGDLLSYNEMMGLWEDNGEIEIKKHINSIIKKISSKGRSEIIELIKIENYFDRNRLNNTKYIAFENMVRNNQTKEIIPFDKELYLTNKISTTFKKDAKCPIIEKFIKEISIDENTEKTLYELIGYCLVSGYPIQTAAFLVGRTANGKSTYLNLIEKFIGEENVCNIEMQQLELKDYYVAQLYNKKVNIAADLPAKMLKSDTNFKKATGRDTFEVAKKFGQPFRFKNSAKFINSCNELPAVRDLTDAYIRRSMVIKFKRQFLGKADDKELLAKMTTKEELSGLLNKVLYHLEELLERGKFSKDESFEDLEDKRKIYVAEASTVLSFWENKCSWDESAKYESITFYGAYTEYCREMEKDCKLDKQFYRELREYCPDYWKKRITVGNIKPYFVYGIKLLDLEGEIF